MANISKIKLPNGSIYDIVDDSKQPKDLDAVEGNLAEFDANGNTVDSGLGTTEVDSLDILTSTDTTAASDNSVPTTGWVESNVPTNTSDLTNDSGFITINDVPEEVFLCTYGITTYADAIAAYNAGKSLYCIYENESFGEVLIPITMVRSNGMMFFGGIVANAMYSCVKLAPNGNWVIVADLSAFTQPDDLGALATKDTVDYDTDVTNKPTIDSALSSTSTNAVQNKVITLALSGKSDSGHTHDDRYYTESEVDTKLSTKLDTSLKGAFNGLAELDENGKVPSAQLPSYVDDVIEVEDYASLPITGEAGKIYITKDTNKTYRWTGTSYAEISASLALGETSSTAYRGDRGKAAYDHSTSPHAPTDSKPAASDGTTLSLVTTGEKYTWNNKGTYSKPSTGIPKTDLASAVQTSLDKADTALQSHQDVSGKMDKTNPTGTGSFSLNRKANTTVGSYSFAEGYSTTASGESSHAEGGGTIASGDWSHVEGGDSQANGDYSHAEGDTTKANSNGSHAEGERTLASGVNSHAEGWGTLATEGSQHVQGKYNYNFGTIASPNAGDYLDIVGNGTSSNRSNAYTLDQNGTGRFKGDVYVNCNADSSGGTKLGVPTAMSWTNGTSGAVKANITGTNVSVTSSNMPEASINNGGIVNTVAQTFGGIKTFGNGSSGGVKLYDATTTIDDSSLVSLYTSLGLL